MPKAKNAFQSTRPSRDGTLVEARQRVPGEISIHPPLAGRDIPMWKCAGTHPNFNPPAPRGTGLILPRVVIHTTTFQSTRPSRDGTKSSCSIPGTTAISIHPPLAGRDSLHGMALQEFDNFNPPAPRGTGPTTRRNTDIERNFNPPAPRGTGPMS